MMQGVGRLAVARCDRFRRPPFSEEADALTRRFLTPAHRAGIAQLTEWMQAAGMAVRLDAAGTLIGRYEGGGGKTLLIGSHIDTVRDAGAYDGTLGVMLGLGVVERLSRAGRRFPFAIEILAFGDEEGSRFAAPMLGSRSLAGLSPPPGALESVDADGLTLSAALAAFGLAPGELPLAARARTDIVLYFEPHIEQGPVLEAEGLPVGIVTGIAAQTRLSVTLNGEANHAGTTPMGLRRDALAAGAEVVLALEAIARREGIVGTVGAMAATPGLGNVISGQVRFPVDLRAPTDLQRDAAEAQFRAELQRICASRGVTAAVTLHQRMPACRCDDTAQALLTQAVAAAGVRPFHLASGAGHDAMSVAALAPVAMLFIRCARGISHNPREAVESADVEIAAQVMLEFISRLARLG